MNPGFGGQGFIQSQVKKIKKLREMCNEYGVDPWIEVDGGVSPKNAAEVRICPSLSSRRSPCHETSPAGVSIADCRDSLHWSEGASSAAL